MESKANCSRAYTLVDAIAIISGEGNVDIANLIEILRDEIAQIQLDHEMKTACLNAGIKELEEDLHISQARADNLKDQVYSLRKSI